MWVNEISSFLLSSITLVAQRTSCSNQVSYSIRRMHIPLLSICRTRNSQTLIGFEIGFKACFCASENLKNVTQFHTNKDNFGHDIT